MRVDDRILELILKTAIGKQIPESKVFETVDQNDLSTLQYSAICGKLIMQGYEIIPDNEIVLPETESYQKNTSTIPNNPFDDVIREFNKLELADKYKCLVALACNIAAQDKQAQEAIAEQFIQQVLSMRLQYSYIAVFLKAFFSRCNALGKVKLSDMIDYAGNYYRNRLELGAVSEQDDSVLSKFGFESKDVKKIAIFNPLKRSFVSNYFEYNKAEDLICISESLWDLLSNFDKTEVLRICDEKLTEYFEKISK